MNRRTDRLLTFALVALAAIASWRVAAAQTELPTTKSPAIPIKSQPPVAQPVAQPAAPEDPTIPNEQLRGYLQMMARKDHGIPGAGAKPLEVSLQALVVNNRGEGMAILTVSGRGSFTVSAGSVIALSGDVSGPQLKVIALSASGVEVLLPQAKTPVTIN